MAAGTVLLLIAQTGCGGAGSSTPTSAPSASSSTTVTAPPSTTVAASSSTTTVSLAGLPQPIFAETVDLQPVSGRVLIQVPGTTGFVALSGPRQVPIGSVLDATAGVVRLATSTPAPEHLQSGTFYSGIFQVLQSRAGGGLTVFQIRDNRTRRATCGSTPADQAKPTILGLFRGSGQGHFSTEGEFAAATVLGTEWGVRNRCDGTLVVVQRGVVDVRDFRLHKDVIVRTGQTYLAKAG